MASCSIIMSPLTPPPTHPTHQLQVTNDLWDAWGESSGLPVKEVMSTWTLQMGYPLLTVEEDEKGGLKVTQQRFLKDGAAEVREREDACAGVLQFPSEIFDVKSG